MEQPRCESPDAPYGAMEKEELHQRLIESLQTRHLEQIQTLLAGRNSERHRTCTFADFKRRMFGDIGAEGTDANLFGVFQEANSVLTFAIFHCEVYLQETLDGPDGPGSRNEDAVDLSLPEDFRFSWTFAERCLSLRLLQTMRKETDRDAIYKVMRGLMSWSFLSRPSMVLAMDKIYADDSRWLMRLVLELRAEQGAPRAASLARLVYNPLRHSLPAQFNEPDLHDLHTTLAERAVMARDLIACYTLLLRDVAAIVLAFCS